MARLGEYQHLGGRQDETPHAERLRKAHEEAQRLEIIFFAFVAGQVGVGVTSCSGLEILVVMKKRC